VALEVAGSSPVNHPKKHMLNNFFKEVSLQAQRKAHTKGVSYVVQEGKWLIRCFPEGYRSIIGVAPEEVPISKSKYKLHE
jgi:hypothetical protein